MNLELLIDRFQKKDVSAYEKLYNMYCDSISGVVHTIVKNDNVSSKSVEQFFKQDIQNFCDEVNGFIKRYLVHLQKN